MKKMTLRGLVALLFGFLMSVSCAGSVSDSAAHSVGVSVDDPWFAYNLAHEELVAFAQQRLSSCPTGQILFNATAVGDAQVSEAAPATAYPSNTAAGIGGVTGSRKKAFLAFNFASIPAGSTINAAELTVTSPGATPAGTLDVYAATGAWTEASITWNGYVAQPALGASLASTATAGTLGAVSTFTSLSSAIAALIAGPNNGLVVDKQASVVGGLATRENSTTGYRPSLSICYTPPAPTCVDSIKNGVETAIDCGGGTCPTCANGFTCIVNSDCVSAYCTGGHCTTAPAGCTDGIRNGLETDIDCGGVACAACTVGQSCVVANDCSTTTCGSSSTCIPAPTCAGLTTIAISPINATYGPAGELLTIFPPSGTPPAGGWPYMVGIPGGGFIGLPGGGRLAGAFTFWASILNAEGIGLITADYVITSPGSPHSINPFPAALNDMRYLDCWIQANASTYNIDVTRVGWAGFSAGGNLVGIFATSLSTNMLPSGTVLTTPTCSLPGTVKFWVGYYANVSMVPAQWSAANPNEWYYLDSYPVGGSLPVGPMADATVVVHPGDPPALLTDGSSDTTVLPIQLSTLVAQARSAAVPMLHVVIPGGVHGYGPAQWGPAIYQPSTCALNAWAQWLLTTAPLPPL